jgi:hypothetical protein
MITGTRNRLIGTCLFSIKAGWYEVIDNKGCCTRVLDKTLYDGDEYKIQVTVTVQKVLGTFLLRQVGMKWMHTAHVTGFFQMSNYGPLNVIYINGRYQCLIVP